MSQRMKNSGLKRWQIAAHGFPDNRQFDRIVLMPQPVSKSPDVAPRYPWTQFFRFVAKATRRFADDQQLALDSRDCFGIFAECIKTHSGRELFDQEDGVRNIAQ